MGTTWGKMGVNEGNFYFEIIVMIVDSHVHFWKFDRKRHTWINKDMKMLQKDHLPEHLSLTLSRNNITGVVAVQADQSELETLFLSELAKTHPIIKGIVGWVNLQDENIEERLQYFSQFTHVKGFRHIAENEPAGFLLKSEMLRGISALNKYSFTYDILLQQHQLQDAVKLVDHFPGQKFVLDHCGKPNIPGNGFNEWKTIIEDMATHPNIVCKVSGLFTQADWKQWSPSDFYPYLDVVFKSFGTGRLMFGSDWPVMLLSGIYVQWKSLLEKYMEEFSSDETDLVFGLNAKSFYNL